MQIDSSNESHILICSIQCNFDNLLTKSDFIKFEPDTETETETQSRDKQKQKWDKKQKWKLVIQIESSNESHILICSIQCNFNNVLTKSDS